MEFYDQEVFFDKLLGMLQEGITSEQISYFAAEGFISVENNNWKEGDLNMAQIRLKSHEELDEEVVGAFFK